MSRECFDNEELARQMNERFINIKVDREERPEIDAIYMNALIAMNGQGGWPLNLFLTPEQEPYFGGTYFPPVPGNHQPGFGEVLRQVHDQRPTALPIHGDQGVHITPSVSLPDSFLLLE